MESDDEAEVIVLLIVLVTILVLEVINPESKARSEEEALLTVELV